MEKMDKYYFATGVLTLCLFITMGLNFIMLREVFEARRELKLYNKFISGSETIKNIAKTVVLS